MAKLKAQLATSEAKVQVIAQTEACVMLANAVYGCSLSKAAETKLLHNLVHAASER